jgi:hypothetical protein
MPTRKGLRMNMFVHVWHKDYATAERSADYYKGDTQTDLRVRVVEDLAEPRSPYPFAVVVGDVPDDERYEVQYEA